MIKFKNIKLKYSKMIIDEYTFIKEEAIDTKLGVINVEIFLKINNSYRMVNQKELPNSYILKLTDIKNYKDLSFIEISNFNKYKESLIDKIKQTNQLDNRVCELFGNVYQVNKEDNFFILQANEVNEFYKVNIREFNLLMIPYVICDLLEKNNKYDNQLFLIGTNLFVQISNQKICSLIQVNEKTGECQIVRVYMIKKIDNEFIVSIDINDEKIDKLLQKEIDKFVKKLEEN